MASKAILELNEFFNIRADMADKARLAVQKTIARVHEVINEEFSEPKSGREYTRGGKPHIASAPGEPPAIDTGNLANSISHQMVGSHTGEVSVGAEYGLVLELGGARMEPRPFAQPAAEKVWPEFLRAMESLE
jgi:hypothetical protein